MQLSIPLSLGLLGALSIIRFRTPIKEPEEVGFIMLVIAAAVSAATFNFRFLVLLYVMALASLLLARGARAWTFLRRDGVLVLTLPAEGAAAHVAAVETVLKARLRRHRLESAACRDGTAFERGRIQRALLVEATAGRDSLDDLDWATVDRMVHARLSPLDVET